MQLDYNEILVLRHSQQNKTKKHFQKMNLCSCFLQVFLLNA